MDRSLFKDAVYSPEICKLMLGLTIAGPMPEGVEGTRAPYVLEVSVPNADEAKAFLKSVGLDDIPFTCLEDRWAPDYSNEANINPQGNTGTAFGLLKSIGGWGGTEKTRRDPHLNARCPDCASPTNGITCVKCGYPGDGGNEDDLHWPHEGD